MGVKRYELSDGQWTKIALLLPGKPSDPGRTGSDNRLFVNGCLWVLRSGAHWRDLPERYGKWRTVHRRFSRWCHGGVWERVFEALTADRDKQVPDARQHHRPRSPAGGERKRGAKDQALGRSRGGLTTKIHMLADGLGRPLRLIVTAGQAGDAPQAQALLEGQVGEAVLADKAYDSNALRKIIAEMGAQPVIPSNRTRKILIPHDEIAYKQRNRIERCFNRLKHSDASPPAMNAAPSTSKGFAFLAASMIWMS